MIEFKITSDIAKIGKVMDSVANDIRFAQALALTATANQARNDLRVEMQRVFDRPTRYALNSMGVKSADRKGDLVAAVFLKEFAGKGVPATKYLWAQIHGGNRRAKRFEVSLEKAGLLPVGMRAVPGQGARIDAYGNMNRGQVVKILSALKATSDVTQHANPSRPSRRKLRNEKYFVAGKSPKTKHLAPGIYLRTQKVIKPVVLYVDRTSYAPRFKFHDVAQASQRKHFMTELDRALAKVMGKARR